MDVIVYMDEDHPLIKISLVPVEDRFHPLFDMDGEEDGRRIAATLPPLFVSAPPAAIKQQPVLRFYTILWKIGRDTDQLYTIVLHDLEVVMLKIL